MYCELPEFLVGKIQEVHITLLSTYIETDVIMEAYLKSDKSFNEIMTFLRPQHHLV